MPRKVSATNRKIQTVKQNKGIYFGFNFPPTPMLEMVAQIEGMNSFLPAMPPPAAAIDKLGLTFTGVFENADGSPVTVDLGFGQSPEEAEQVEKVPTPMQRFTVEQKLTIPGIFWGTAKGIVFVGALSASGTGLLWNMGAFYVQGDEGDDPADTDAENRELDRLRRDLNLRNKRLGLTMPPSLTPEKKRCEGCGMEFVPESRSDQRFHDHACEARFNARRRREQAKKAKMQTKDAEGTKC